MSIRHKFIDKEAVILLLQQLFFLLLVCPKKSSISARRCFVSDQQPKCYPEKKVAFTNVRCIVFFRSVGRCLKAVIQKGAGMAEA